MIDYVDMDGSPQQAAWARRIRNTFYKQLNKPNLSLEDKVVLGCSNAALLIENREFLETGNAVMFCKMLNVQWQDWTEFEGYHTFLLEKYRSPSKGGNTSAIHSHKINIGDTSYFFTARGARKWAFKGDTIKFAWYPRNHRHFIFKGTLEVRDKNRTPVIRGDRRAKPIQRSAEQRLPCSRRETR